MRKHFCPHCEATRLVRVVRKKELLAVLDSDVLGILKGATLTEALRKSRHEDKERE